MTSTAPPRAPYGGLDRETVVAALLQLAREHGIDRVTMRMLAAALETSAPAVYYYVPNKQALLDLVADALLAQVEVPGPRGPWTERLTRLYANGRTVLVTVPGIAGVLQSRPLAPTGRALDAAGLTILREAGFDARTARKAHALLYSYLVGAVSLEHAVPRPTRGAPSADATFEFGLQTIVVGLEQRLAGR